MDTGAELTRFSSSWELRVRVTMMDLKEFQKHLLSKETGYFPKQVQGSCRGITSESAKSWVSKEITHKSNVLTPFPTKGKWKTFFNFSKSPFGPSVRWYSCQRHYWRLQNLWGTVRVSMGLFRVPKGPPWLGGICRDSLKYHNVSAGLIGRLRDLISVSLRDALYCIIALCYYFITNISSGFSRKISFKPGKNRRSIVWGFLFVWLLFVCFVLFFFKSTCKCFK